MNQLRRELIAKGVIFPLGSKRLTGWDAQRLAAAGFHVAAQVRRTKELCLKLEMTTAYGKLAA